MKTKSRVNTLLGVEPVLITHNGEFRDTGYLEHRARIAKEPPKSGQDFTVLDFRTWSELWEDGGSRSDIMMKHRQRLAFREKTEKNRRFLWTRNR
jgi:hypothetical protein